MDLLKSIEKPITDLLLNPKNHELLAIVKSIRNGMVYGAKVRFPHALVMIFLFRSGTFRQKILLVLKATRQHARNLGYFALIYKTSLLLLAKLSEDGKTVRPFDPFVAGLLGGYVVFGRSRSSVSQQIVTYVFARVALGFAKLAFKAKAGSPGSSPNLGSSGSQRGGWEIVKDPNVREIITNNAWPVFASVSWALVMWLFRWHPDVLQPSLRSSMSYIYVDSEKWDSVRNFIWHNK